MERRQKILLSYGNMLARRITRRKISFDFLIARDIIFMERLAEKAGIDTKKMWKPYNLEYSKISTKMFEKFAPKISEKPNAGAVKHANK